MQEEFEEKTWQSADELFEEIANRVKGNRGADQWFAANGIDFKKLGGRLTNYRRYGAQHKKDGVDSLFVLRILYKLGFEKTETWRKSGDESGQTWNSADLLLGEIMETPNWSYTHAAANRPLKTHL